MRHSQRRPPFVRLVPLAEIIAEVLGCGPTTKRVGVEYRSLIQGLGSELQVLMRASASDLERLSGERLAQAILSARVGSVDTEPGFDGVYGKVRAKPVESRD